MRLAGLLILCLVVVPLVHTRSRVDSTAINGNRAVAASIPGEKPSDANDGLALLRASLNRCTSSISGYRGIMEKQERINGRLGPVETVEFGFREAPFSVFLKWKSAPTGQADRALYIAGSFADQMLVRPKSAMARAVVGNFVARDPEGPEARAAGRYTIRQFGIRQGMERTLSAWEAAATANQLVVSPLGVQSCEQVGGRRCHVLRRTCDPPEEDGLRTLVIWIDTATLLQIGSELIDGAGQRIAAYYFRDLEINPGWTAEEFTKTQLTQQ